MSTIISPLFNRKRFSEVGDTLMKKVNLDLQNKFDRAKPGETRSVIIKLFLFKLFKLK